MNGNNDEVVSANENVDEFERSGSLCTLCVLETMGANSDGMSSSIPSILTPVAEINFGASRHRGELTSIQKDAGRPNYFSRFDNQAIFYNVTMKTTTDTGGDNRPQKNDCTLTPIFDNDDVTHTPKSFTDLLRRLESLDDKQSLDKSSQRENKEKNRPRQSIFCPSGSDNPSLEFPIGPDKSQTIVHNVMNHADASALNPSSEAVRCYLSGIADDEIPLKKVKFDNAEHPTKESLNPKLKRDDETNDHAEPINNIPRKKPRVVASEILKFPLNHLLTRNHETIAKRASQTTARAEEHRVDTEEFQGAMRRLRILKDAAGSNEPTLKTTKTHRSKVDDKERGSRSVEAAGQIQRAQSEGTVAVNCPKIDNNEATALMGLKSGSNCEQLRWNAGTSHSLVNLSMLQVKMAENSKRLIDQANEMRQLSKNATPKRTTLQCRLPLKRRRIDNVSSSPGAKENDEKALVRSDILAAKRRICTKRRELDNLTRTRHYIRKHDMENLLGQISKWRTASKEALFDLHKRIRDKSSENATMRQVLAMLGIAEETVKFTEEECDLN